MVINVFWNVPRREIIFETLIYFHTIGCNYILLEKLQTSMKTPAVLVQQYISIGGNCQIYIMSLRLIQVSICHIMVGAWICFDKSAMYAETGVYIIYYVYYTLYAKKYNPISVVYHVDSG